MPKTDKTPTDRFWIGVNKNGPVHPVCGQCWVWTKSKIIGGYGQMRVNGSNVRVHCYSYILHTGNEIPKGMYICHRCDEPSCVNPDHLFLGTAKDNHDDMSSKGRRATQAGSGNNKAKLTEVQVEDIRKRYRRWSYHGSNKRELANEFGVCTMTILQIAKGETWRKEKINGAVQTAGD